MSRYNAKTQDMTDDEFIQLIDKERIFYEVVGPLKKKQVYGLGNKGYIIVPTKYRLIVSI